jgi:hypothetical protein
LSCGRRRAARKINARHRRHDARQGRLGRDDVVVFLHTGGLPAVFAYRDDLLPHLHPT